MSKLNQAIEIVKANPDKKAALTAIQEALGVTRANASVYMFKAMKAIGAPSKPVKVEKTEVAPEPVSAPTRDFTDIDKAEYEAAMVERAKFGFSPLEIQEYFEIKSNLAALA